MSGIEAYVDLIPRLGMFGSQVKREVSTATKGVGAAVIVTPEMSKFAKDVAIGTKKADTKVDVPVNADTSKLSKQLGSEGQQAGRSFGGNFTSVVSGVFTGGALLGLAKQAGQAIMGELGGAIQQSDATDKFKQALGFAGVQAKQIGQIVAQSQDYANQTVYDLSDIQSMTGQLVSNGIKGGEQLAESLGNLNAVAGGTKNTYSELGLVLTQTNSLGKLNTQNWDQFANDLPGASGILRKELLKDKAYTGDFANALATGQISADEFNKALEQLGQTDAAKKAATSTKTIEGSWGNMQAAITGGLAEIITKLKPTITMVMNDLTPALTTMADDITKDVLPPVTGLFNFFSKHAGTLEVTAKAIGAIAGSIALLSAINTAIAKFKEFQVFVVATRDKLLAMGLAGTRSGAEVAAGAAVGEDGVVALGNQAQATSGKIGLMGKALGVAGIAFAGIQVGGGIATKLMGQYTLSNDQATKSLINLAKQGKDTGSTLSDAFKQPAKHGTQPYGDILGGWALGVDPQIKGLNDALNRTFNRSGVQKVNDWATGVMHAVGLPKGQLAVLKDQFGSLDTSLGQMASGGHTKQAAAAFAQIKDEAKKQGISVAQLTTLFPQYEDALTAAKNAARENGGAQHDLSTKVITATDMLKEQTAALVKNREKMLANANAALGLSGDEINYKQSIKDATDAAKQNGKTLDENTQKGRDNRSALDSMASSSLAYIQDLIKQHASTQKLTSVTEDARQKFIKVAMQMGDTRDQAKKLADQYGLIPKKIDTKIDDPGFEKVKNDLKDVKQYIDNIHGKNVTVTVTSHNATRVGGGGSAVAQAKATGGPITGPGSGTSDSVLIAASNGEYMQTAASHKFYGTGVMDAIKSMSIPKDVLASYAYGKYASGGPINIRGQFAGNPAAIGRSLTALVNAAAAQSAAVPAGLSGNAVGSLQKYALSLFPSHGWDASMFGSLKALWNGESGWNPRAYNASSGATGIPQALPGSKMASAGADWRTNGDTQIRWGEDYIRSVYGNPVNAYSRWLSRNPHWYGAGTSYALPGPAIIGENGPERLWLRGGERIDSAGKTRQTAEKDRKMTLHIHYGQGFEEKVQAILDDNDEFHASVMRTRG